MPRNRVSNRFTRGSACYACRCCKRQTRDTGRGDNEGVRLCVDCFEIAGMENGLSDSGLEYFNEQYKAACIGHFMNLKKLGGFSDEQLAAIHGEAYEACFPNGGPGAPAVVEEAVVMRASPVPPADIKKGAYIRAKEIVFGNMGAPRKEVIALCAAEGIKFNTADSAYYELVTVPKKNVAVAAVMNAALAIA